MAFGTDVFNMLHVLEILPLVLHDGIDFFRARALLVKSVVQPLLCQPPRNLYAHDPLAHTQHLRVIAQHSPLDAETVVRGHGPDARDLVRRNGNTQPGAADEQRAVRTTLGHELRRVDGRVRVRGLVVARVDADVDDAGDAGVGFKVGLDLALVAAAGVVTAEGDGEGFVCRHFSLITIDWCRSPRLPGSARDPCRG